ncbi:MAG: hypothetical protein ACRDSK_22880 [Actinophytocola sp.]|uniref:hypothetical protein n=1 Tax=Actinophytocola sp. TaxID=1872138 RepID=UPI003D6AD6A9
MARVEPQSARETVELVAFVIGGIVSGIVLGWIAGALIGLAVRPGDEASLLLLGLSITVGIAGCVTYLLHLHDAGRRERGGGS